MPISVQCGKCQKQFSLRDEVAGKRIRCSACDNVMTVPARVPQRRVPHDSGLVGNLFADGLDTADLAAGSVAPDAPARSNVLRPKRASHASHPSRLRRPALILAAGLGTTALLALGVYLAIFKGDDKKKSPADAGATAAGLPAPDKAASGGAAPLNGALSNAAVLAFPPDASLAPPQSNEILVNSLALRVPPGYAEVPVSQQAIESIRRWTCPVGPNGERAGLRVHVKTKNGFGSAAYQMFMLQYADEWVKLTANPPVETCTFCGVTGERRVYGGHVGNVPVCGVFLFTQVGDKTITAMFVTPETPDSPGYRTLENALLSLRPVPEKFVWSAPPVGNLERRIGNRFAMTMPGDFAALETRDQTNAVLSGGVNLSWQRQQGGTLEVIRAIVSPHRSQSLHGDVRSAVDGLKRLRINPGTPPPGEKTPFCGQEGLRSYVIGSVEGRSMQGVVIATVVGEQTVIALYFTTHPRDSDEFRAGEAALLTLNKK